MSTLDEAQVAHGRQLHAHVGQRGVGAVDDGDFEHDVVLVHAHKRLGVHGVGKARQLVQPLQPLRKGLGEDGRAQRLGRVHGPLGLELAQLPLAERVGRGLPGAQHGAPRLRQPTEGFVTELRRLALRQLELAQRRRQSARAHRRAQDGARPSHAFL
jgi:hypothetical protein